MVSLFVLFLKLCFTLSWSWIYKICDIYFSSFELLWFPSWHYFEQVMVTFGHFCNPFFFVPHNSKNWYFIHFSTFCIISKSRIKTEGGGLYILSWEKSCLSNHLLCSVYACNLSVCCHRIWGFKVRVSGILP